MLYNNKIEICPLAFMRGRTFKHAVIIADEMQNSSPNQMKMLLTRLGSDTRLIITGDLQQTDLKGDNGLRDFISKYETYENQKQTKNTRTLIQIVNFENEDIERSDVVKKVIEIYDYKLIKKQNTIVNSYSSSSISKQIVKIQSQSINDSDAALIPFYHLYSNSKSTNLSSIISED